ncbi:hypothetical protein E4U41_006569 [Claviceps citrina]|nr:hypothetical protein E4U41_006569 [Claviceps citrina]
MDVLSPQGEGMKDLDDAADGWDIDADSAYHPSEDPSVSASPARRQMGMLSL